MEKEQITLTSIDGIYGRVDYNTLSEQGTSNITHNEEILDRRSNKTISSEEYLTGLPIELTKDDYFRMAILNSIRDLTNSMCGINITLEGLNSTENKTIE